MFITRHPYIQILIDRFEECNKRIILVNYGHNQMVGFSERHGQNLVKVGCKVEFNQPCVGFIP